MLYKEYTDAVVASLRRQTGWTEQEARNVATDLHDFIADDMTAEDAVSELIYAMTS